MKHFIGEGVTQSDREAVSLFRLVAEQGNANAQTSLGVMYDLGRGVPEDDVQGYAWLSIAASQNNEEARVWRDRLRSSMTATQLAAGQDLAAGLWKRIEESTP